MQTKLTLKLKLDVAPQVSESLTEISVACVQALNLTSWATDKGAASELDITTSQ